MKKCCLMITLLINSASLLFAEPNAVIEVKLFKTWVIKGEQDFFSLAIKNIGTEPFLLAKDTFEFSTGQLFARSLDNKSVGSTGTFWFSCDEEYKTIEWGEGFEPLPAEETRVFDGRKFRLVVRVPFAETIQYKVSVYLGNNFWLDSEPLTVNGVLPDAIEDLEAVKDNTRNLQDPPRGLMTVTYKNERWLYIKSMSGKGCYSVCPLSLTNKIRVEPHDGGALFKIWDGDKSMIFHMHQMMLLEGPDENNVFGKWTRERKQQAEADNAEVRKKKAEVP